MFLSLCFIVTMMEPVVQTGTRSSDRTSGSYLVQFPTISICGHVQVVAHWACLKHIVNSIYAHTLTSFSIFARWQSFLSSIMPETCIRFGEHRARIMIENKEVPHYAMHVDPAKKEVSCWIASEAGKVREPLFARHLVHLWWNTSRPFRLCG